MRISYLGSLSQYLIVLLYLVSRLWGEPIHKRRQITTRTIPAISTRFVSTTTSFLSDCPILSPSVDSSSSDASAGSTSIGTPSRQESSTDRTTYETTIDGTLTTVTNNIGPTATPRIPGPDDIFRIYAAVGSDDRYMGFDDRDFAVLRDTQQDTFFSYSAADHKLYVIGDVYKVFYALLPESPRLVKRQALRGEGVATAVTPRGRGSVSNTTVTANPTSGQPTIQINNNGTTGTFGTNCPENSNRVGIFFGTTPEQNGCTSVNLVAEIIDQNPEDGTSSFGTGVSTTRTTDETTSSTASTPGSETPGCQTPVPGSGRLSCEGPTTGLTQAINGRTYRLCTGESRPGSGLISATTGGLQVQCAERCASSLECRGFSFDSQSQRCSLFSAVSSSATISASSVYGIFVCNDVTSNGSGDGGGSGGGGGTDNTGGGGSNGGGGGGGTGGGGNGGIIPQPTGGPGPEPPDECDNPVTQHEGVTCPAGKTSVGPLESPDGAIYTMCPNTATYTDIPALGTTPETYAWRYCLQRALDLDNVLAFAALPARTGTPPTYTGGEGLCAFSDAGAAVNFETGLPAAFILGFITCKDTTPVDATCPTEGPSVPANAALQCPTGISKRVVRLDDENMVYTACYPARTVGLNNQWFVYCLKRCKDNPKCIGFELDVSAATLSCQLTQTPPDLTQTGGNKAVVFFNCRSLLGAVSCPFEDSTLEANESCATSQDGALWNGITYKSCATESRDGLSMDIKLKASASSTCIEACSQIEKCLAIKWSSATKDCTFFRHLYDESPATDADTTTSWLVCLRIDTNKALPACTQQSTKASTSCLSSSTQIDTYYEEGLRAYRYCIGQAVTSGTVISNLRTESIADCAYACAGQYSCRTFSFDSNGEDCVLYSNDGSGSVSDFSVSGWITCDSTGPPSCPSGSIPGVFAKRPCGNGHFPTIGWSTSEDMVIWRDCSLESVANSSPFGTVNFITEPVVCAETCYSRTPESCQFFEFNSQDSSCSLFSAGQQFAGSTNNPGGQVAISFMLCSACVNGDPSSLAEATCGSSSVASRPSYLWDTGSVVTQCDGEKERSGAIESYDEGIPSNGNMNTCGQDICGIRECIMAKWDNVARRCTCYSSLGTGNAVAADSPVADSAIQFVVCQGNNWLSDCPAPFLATRGVKCLPGSIAPRITLDNVWGFKGCQAEMSKTTGGLSEIISQLTPSSYARGIDQALQDCMTWCRNWSNHPDTPCLGVVLEIIGIDGDYRCTLYSSVAASGRMVDYDHNFAYLTCLGSARPGCTYYQSVSYSTRCASGRWVDNNEIRRHYRCDDYNVGRRNFNPYDTTTAADDTACVQTCKDDYGKCMAFVFDTTQSTLNCRLYGVVFDEFVISDAGFIFGYFDCMEPNA